MATVKFKTVKIGQQFVLEGRRWVKVKPIMKTCCKMKLNCKSALDPSITKVVDQNQEVVIDEV